MKHQLYLERRQNNKEQGNSGEIVLHNNIPLQFWLKEYFTFIFDSYLASE